MRILVTQALLAGALAVGLGAIAGQAVAQEARDLGKQALERQDVGAFLPGSVLVKFRDDAVDASRTNARLAVAGRTAQAYRIVRGLERLEIGMNVDQAVALLRAMPSVEYAEPDYIYRTSATTPNDEFFGLQWGMHNVGQDIRGASGTPDADIDMIEAWDIATGDPNFVIAVIDSGVQWDHPDLDANIWTNSGEIAGNGIDDDGNGYVDDVRGWDFYDNDNNPDDADGHGTHVAGTIGAEGNNGIGVAGVMWSCKIMPLRFIGPFGGATSDAISAIEYAVDNGATISNNSWGGGAFSTALRDTIASAGASGHLFVAAAGNGGQNADVNPEYPAAYNLDNIISVANMANDDTLWGTSTYGATTVDLGAPGNDIASTYNGSSYVWLGGTSMASPHVAGVAALVWSQNPGWSWSDVKNQILGTVRPVASIKGLTVTGGMLNAYAALTGAPPPPPPATPAAPSNPAASDNGDGTASFTWSDNSGNEDGFEIERERKIRKNRWGETAVGTTGANATGITDNPGSFDTFRYRVRAFNAGGSSVWSAWAEVTLVDPNGGGGGGGGGNGGGKGGGKPK
ncbi:MAG: S8 family serine peptidase [Phycisphaerales bacterium]